MWVELAPSRSGACIPSRGERRCPLHLEPRRYEITGSPVRSAGVVYRFAGNVRAVSQSRGASNHSTPSGGSVIKMEYGSPLYGTGSAMTPPALPTLLPPHISASVLRISR